MKAYIKENIDEIIAKEHGDLLLSDPEYIELRDRIKGKIVNLVFTHGDAFEEEDNNLWLPEDCWEEIKEES